MSRPKRILTICHLCLAFIYLCWLLIQPYVREIISQKTERALYEMILQRESLFAQLDPTDQQTLTEGSASVGKNGPSLIKATFRLVFSETPPFALAWLFFSIAVSILLLFQIEGAMISAWLLPLIIGGYIFSSCNTHVEKRASLYPSEEYVLTTYVQNTDNKLWERRKELLFGWHRYLVKEWAHEIPSENPMVFQEQLDKALFAFNVARLKWILDGNEDETVLAGFSAPTSFLRLSLYVIWNLFFAWFINRKRHASIAVPLKRSFSTQH